MDNLKKNLHFVVFGAGVLVGIIFVAVAFVWRGGTETALTEAQTKLAPQSPVASQGALDKATARSDRFGASLSDAESALTNKGVAFANNYEKSETGGEFFTNEANLGLRRLQERFDAMQTPTPMPAQLKGWQFVKSGSDKDTFWKGQEGEMASPPKEKIREMQMRLRIMRELAATCEKLIAAGADGGYGMKLVGIKFDPYAPLGSNESDAPWMGMPYQVTIECTPAFATQLVEELTNPTKLTVSDAKDEGPEKRMGFPQMLEMLQAEMAARPSEQRWHIDTDMKADVAKTANARGAGIVIPPDPKQLDENEGEGKKLVEAVSEDLNQNDRVTLPVTVGLKLRALAFNTKWKAVKAETDNQ